MVRPPILRTLTLGALLLLAACSGGSRMAYGPGRTDYPRPGPPGDPWRPYIRQASNRFGVPQQWIRAVMRQESGGQEYRYGSPIVSGAGAMGLMQLMPATYADMQAQNSLGDDPFEPHDNIMAGTAYIRQMYDRYGAPAFLAAYNAGPQRLDDYLNTGRSLPNETVDYVASIGPDLGTQLAMSGPLATYAQNRDAPYVPPAAPVRLASWQVPARRSGGGACWHDPDAAFDPNAPCQAPPVQAPPVQARPWQAPIQVAASAPVRPNDPSCWHDPDAAYDPAAPCEAPPVQVASYAPPPPVRPSPPTMSAVYMPAPPQPRPMPVAAYAAPSPSYGDWSIQVGAYTSPDQARFATTMARQAAYAQLAASRSLVMQTSRFGGAVLYRARLAGLARPGAGAACAALGGHAIPCMVVPPGG